MQQAQEFVSLICGSDTPVFQTCLDDKNKPDHSTFRSGSLDSQLPWLQAAQEGGHGAFLTINKTEGARKAANVTKIRALFVEFDHGEEPEAWHLEPSIVVQSANGKHVYWLLGEDMPVAAFTPAVKRLIAFYHSDPKIHDPSRVLRLPGSLHQKATKGKTPTPRLVTMLSSPGHRYTIAQIMAGIPEIAAAPAKERVAPPRVSGGEFEQALADAASWDAGTSCAAGGKGRDKFKTCAKVVNDYPGLTEEERWQVAQAWNLRCTPPLDDDALEEQLGKASSYSKGFVSAGVAARRRDSQEWDSSLVVLRVQPVQSTQSPLVVNSAAENDKNLYFPVTKRGEPAPDHTANTRALLDHYNVRVMYNQMKHKQEILIAGFTPDRECSANASLAWVQNRAADHGLNRKAVESHIMEFQKAYHPVYDWATASPWDGEDRIPALLDTLVLQENIADPEFRQDLVYRWLLGAAASILPDLKGDFEAQGVLVLQGEQGKQKTRWLKSLAPGHLGSIMTGRHLDPKSKDSVEQITSVWIAELGEIDATFRKSDIAALKAFVTQSEDTFRSAYAHYAESKTRRTVLCASVNEPEYLVDKTGNRRWWTVPIERCNPNHGINMQQLWAQVVCLIREGERWWLNDAEIQRLAAINSEHEPEDIMQGALAEKWVAGPFDAGAPTKGGVTLGTIAKSLPEFVDQVPSALETRRISEALKAMGVRKHRTKLGNLYYVVRLGKVG